MKNSLKTPGNLLFLLKPYWRFGKLYVLGALALAPVCASVSAYAGVSLIQRILDAVASGATLWETLRIVFAYQMITHASTLLLWSYNTLYARWKAVDVQVKIKRAIYEQAIATDFRFFDNPEFYNDFTFAASEFTTVSVQMIDTLSSTLRFISVAATMAVYISTLGPAVAAISVGGSVLMSFAQHMIARCGVGREKEALPHERKLQYIHRVVYQQQYAADIKRQTLAEKLLSAFDDGGRGKTDVYKKWSKPYFRANALNIASYCAMELGVCAYLVVSAFARELGMGALAGLFAAAGRLNGQFNQFVQTVGGFMGFSLYAEKIRKFFALESTIETSAGASPPSGAFNVELRDMSFKYPGSDFALKDISLGIRPGEKIAIVGENGAGKSTLMKLLLRLYNLDGGDILINGHSLRGYDVHALRRRVGVAFQQPNVYAMTLRENLTVYGEADDDALREILDKARLSELRGSLDRDVTREFDENGLMLSGGQAQKLGLARLLVGDFGLLLLDEPSSALDPLAEYEMAKLMFEQARTTTIMIAHRLSTVRSADRIYLIADGVIAERGTHDELIAFGGRYAEMFAKQAENYAG
ncbi:MAG: ABC transporter ATP-binding protein/permease [Oscillospiraceae bacterium]|jgi:ATP-binding cassette subfamily B protein|nr:ABC transporter ATP-binding protein/permease [Oscillospiraceae bacterium]